MSAVMTKVDCETGELIPVNAMVEVEKTPAISLNIDDVKLFIHDPDVLIDRVAKQAAFYVFDVSTKNGREACKSHAANIIRCISPVLAASKQLALEAKKVVNQDVSFRRDFEAGIREIAAYHRKPLTEWENEQESIRQEQLFREQERLAHEKMLVDWDEALIFDELYELRKINTASLELVPLENQSGVNPYCNYNSKKSVADNNTGTVIRSNHSDKEKLLKFACFLSEIPMPDVRLPESVATTYDTKELLTKVVNFIIKRANAL